MIRACVLLLLFVIGAPAIAGTAYQCTGPDGRVTYQDRPCGNGQRQQALQLDDSQPSQPPPATANSAPATVPVAIRPPPSEPDVPLPAMYACIRATDSKPYLSDNGDPPPYQVPYGILGASQLPLSTVYGAPNGPGASAPELNRGRITPGLIANHYVWVQDACRQLSYGETCHALRDAYDENASKLQRAFKSDRPPLEKREAQLLAQLRHC
ncbi:DUF4124 domain-containing protein [Dyella sp. ASV21]|uniref:DUF4124 domain-containing protein n=1 Tax=Dyella sp. ASV21 TaxID=2795114 RepID=UPI0018EBC2AD|nr:DUF4124 domain-containing protein [Dyella sp. ASV21]